MNYYVNFLGRLGSNGFQYPWYPWQLKKIKILRAVLELPAANPAHLPRKWAKWAKLNVLFSWYSKTAPRILIFSIVMGADYSFEVKNIFQAICTNLAL
jgi:hypothetical protein